MENHFPQFLGYQKHSKATKNQKVKPSAFDWFARCVTTLNPMLSTNLAAAGRSIWGYLPSNNIRFTSRPIKWTMVVIPLPETNSKSPWKWTVGIRSFPFGAQAYFQGRTVSFREGNALYVPLDSHDVLLPSLCFSDQFHQWLWRTKSLLKLHHLFPFLEKLEMLRRSWASFLGVFVMNV